MVSVIIPTYNRSWGLRAAIRSVLAQTYADWELIVLDDASTDNTREVLAEFVDQRLISFQNSRNLGMVRNWGEGLDRARGDYLVFLADDDQLKPDFLRHRIEVMQREAVTVVFSQYDVCDKTGRVLATRNVDRTEAKRFGPDQLLNSALSRCWYVGTSLYSVSALRRVWDRVTCDDLVLDFGFNIRLAVDGASGFYLPLNDFIMMSHGGQNSVARETEVFAQTRDTLCRILHEDLPFRCRGAIRRELASWYVVWGRNIAAGGELSRARWHFLSAICAYPTLGSAWRQLLISVMFPACLRPTGAHG